MNWTTELPFILDGVEGGLRLTYSPMGQKLYQDDIEVKRSGSGLGGQKYKVKTTDGGEETIKVKANLKTGRQIVFKGETINLESPLSGLGICFSILPFIFIVLVLIVLKAQIGVLGGALLGACGALGMLAVGNILRNEGNIGKQLIASLVVSVIVTIIFVALLLIVSLIFGTSLAMIFTFFS